MHFTKRNQDELKDAALAPTGSTGWMVDAIAIGASRDMGGPIVAVAVFQNFRAQEADFHFAMLGGARMTAEIVKAMIGVAFQPRLFDLERLWFHVSADNPVAQAACLKIGAEFEYRVRAGGIGKNDVIVLSKLRAGPQLPLPGDTVQTQQA